MMDMNADTRITPSEALLHPWLSGMSDDLRNPLPSAVVSRLGEYQDFGTMKQKVLGMIVKNMEDDELEGFAKMFRRLDADGNGEVTVAEVNAALNQLGLPESEDVDETQTVTYAEFVAACMGRNAFLQEVGFTQEK
jgi:calcium-dependent protein kinase